MSELSVEDQAALEAAKSRGYTLKENRVVNVGYYFVPEGDRNDAPETFPTISEAWSHILKVEGSLHDVRRDAADSAFAEYDFGGLVVRDSGNWEYDVPGVEYTCAVFFENPDDPEGDTVKGHFTVLFESALSTTIRESYGMIDGNLIGEFAPAAPSR